ncbi:MAG: hypothetical protein AAB482_01410 [Patescibacteria group bacterium]
MNPRFLDPDRFTIADRNRDSSGKSLILDSCSLFNIFGVMTHHNNVMP